MKRIITLYLSMIALLGICTHTCAAPKDTIDVVCYDLELNTDFISLFGMTYIFANNSEYKLTGAILADSIPPGTYTDCLMDLTHISSQKKIPAQTVQLTLDRDARNYCIITGTMLGEDNILYNLDLSWQTPTPTDTTVIAFNHTSTVAYYPDLGHDFMLKNEDEQYDIAIDILRVPMGEAFTEKNLNIAYSLIANKTTKDTTKIAAAEGRIWQSNDTTYLSAMVTGFDSVLYDINLWYAVPQATQTTKLKIYNATFYNELESDGYYALVGTTADKSYEFAISLLSDTEEDIPGTYINDGLFGGFSGKNYDFLHFIGGQYATYIAKWNADKNDYDVVSIEKGNAVVTMDEEQNVMLQGTFIGADGVEYLVTLDTKVDKPRIQDDAEEGEINRVFSNEKELTIEQQARDKILLEVMTERDLLAVWFYVDHIDDEIVIPEGEYNIDQSDDFWSVIAGDGSLGKTFYATHDGEFFTSLYFLINGTVKISKIDGKLQFEMHATNSYDVPVHIVYNPTSTDLEHAIGDSNAENGKKVITNGQLIIRYGDKTFNSTGACIK